MIILCSFEVFLKLMKGFLVAFHLNDTKAENMFVLRTVERPRVGVKPGKSVFFL